VTGGQPLAEAICLVDFLDLPALALDVFEHAFHQRVESGISLVRRPSAWVLDDPVVIAPAGIHRLLQRVDGWAVMGGACVVPGDQEQNARRASQPVIRLSLYEIGDRREDLITPPWTGVPASR
jgi:hypothetical protein